MKRKYLIIVAGITVALSCSAFGQQDEKLGKLSFPTSCDPKVQTDFERGVAMMHSYWFIIRAQDIRGECCSRTRAARWRIGASRSTSSATRSRRRRRARTREAAWAALEKARAIGAKTQRERDWIEAMSAYFRDHDKMPVDARLAAYNKAMEHMTQRYPDDYEAQVYYALTLQASASKADMTYANQLKSAAILEKLYEQNPAASRRDALPHSRLRLSRRSRDKGIPAARRYARIAPAVPHARHMPSHIYSMVGLWEESIASNVSAMEIQPDYYHAADFTVYAHLQLAQDARAKALTEKSLATADRGDRPINCVNFTAKAAMPARYVLERADWVGAAALPITPTQYPQADSLTRFTRGLGMARSGDLAGAKARDRGHEDASRCAGKGRTSPTGLIASEEQMLAISAWVALKEGARDQAVKFMRAAADGEDGSVKHVAMENRLYPMRELYGRTAARNGPTGGRPARIRDFAQADAQPLSRVLGHCPCRRMRRAIGRRHPSTTASS